MQQVLKEEGVPQDLIYLAVAESGFQPQIVNTKSGAGGMWQFMTYTGPQFGLIRNGYFDYRFDPEKSTRAYAKYIKALHNQFGDWYLAMAAYDWGPLYVQRAVQRTGYADYWELYRRGVMPAETRAYVPQVLAAVLMAKNPERYGLDKLVPSPPVIYDTVTTNYAIDLHLVADVTNSTVQELVALNPAMLRYSTSPDTSFDLHLPPGTRTLYTDRLKDIPNDRRAHWRFHVVKAGETLPGIAAALHAHEAEIAETNGITAASPMAVDDELVVPVDTPASAVNPQRYTVRRGDTLVTVADRFNISVDELRRWNGLQQTAVRPGRTLYVAEPVRLGPGGRTRARSAHKSARGRSVGRYAKGSRAASAGHTAARGHAATASKKRRAGH
jgi:membrane-bound lytic murein transglycosylase D